jgi:hypothetical protein
LSDFSIENLSKYKYRNFEDYYATIKNLDIYALHARKDEIAARYRQAYENYKSERDKYLSGVYRLNCGSDLLVNESDYQFDRELLTVHVDNFCVKKLGDGTPTIMIMDQQFRPQGFDRHLAFRLPINVAKTYFSSFPGPVGRRVAKAAVRYTVKATGEEKWYNQMAVPEMTLESVELQLGTTAHVTWTKPLRMPPTLTVP